MNDIEIISNNTGIPKWKIQRIKDHLFYNKHILYDNSLRRFDANPEIAASWDRLCKGGYIKNDLALLAHEYAEARFENIFKTNYQITHNKVQQRWPWEYPEFKE